MTYSKALAYSKNLQRFGWRLGLERFSALLERLGNPQNQFETIHIAGTNGKGSTTAMVDSILQTAGYKTGRFMSPHVFEFRERFCLNQTLIPETDFARWVEQIIPAIDEVASNDELGQTTEFELQTAVAFCWFAEQRVDYAVLEVGLGGRWDSTNAIPAPKVAVITHIGLDHQAILGETLAQIAGEKAGILKSGSVLVTGVERPEALEVIVARAAELDVPLHRSEGNRVADIPLKLQGDFQRLNAAVAFKVGQVLGLSETVIRQGLEAAWLPGRFQVEGKQRSGMPTPLILDVAQRSMVPTPLILDVAHNADGAEVLHQALQAHFPDQRFAFVVGMTQGHEPSEFLGILEPCIAKVYAVTPSERPHPAQEVYEAALALNLEAEIGREVPEVLAGLTEPTVVTGSFYVVGQVPKQYRTTRG